MMEESLPKMQEMLAMKDDAEKMISEVHDLLKEVEANNKKIVRLSFISSPEVPTIVGGEVY